MSQRTFLFLHSLHANDSRGFLTLTGTSTSCAMASIVRICYASSTEGHRSSLPGHSRDRGLATTLTVADWIEKTVHSQIELDCSR